MAHDNNKTPYLYPVHKDFIDFEINYSKAIEDNNYDFFLYWVDTLLSDCYSQLYKVNDSDIRTNIYGAYISQKLDLVDSSSREDIIKISPYREVFNKKELRSSIEAKVNMLLMYKEYLVNKGSLSFSTTHKHISKEGYKELLWLIYYYNFSGFLRDIWFLKPEINFSFEKEITSIANFNSINSIEYPSLSEEEEGNYIIYSCISKEQIHKLYNYFSNLQFDHKKDNPEHVIFLKILEFGKKTDYDVVFVVDDF